jgi:hypothetical protein
VSELRCWLGLLLGAQRMADDEAEIYRAVRAEARAAVRGGFRAVVAPEHADARPYRMLQPWPLLGAVREAVDGPVAAVASVIAGLTTAERLAADVANLRAIGAGPAGAALAAGYRREDFASAGRDFATRFDARGRILASLAESRACDEGWLWSAAGTARAVRRAGSAGAHWYGGPTLSEHDAVAFASGAATDCVLRRDVLLGADPDDLQDRWARFVAPKYGAYAAWGYDDGDARAVIAGTGAEIAGRLRDLIVRVRPRGIVLRLCWPDMSPAEGLAHVEAFAAGVAPSLVPASSGALS